MIQKVYSESAVHRATVFYWYNMFSEGRESIPGDCHTVYCQSQPRWAILLVPVRWGHCAHCCIHYHVSLGIFWDTRNFTTVVASTEPWFNPSGLFSEGIYQGPCLCLTSWEYWSPWMVNYRGYCKDNILNVKKVFCNLQRQVTTCLALDGGHIEHML